MRFLWIYLAVLVTGLWPTARSVCIPGLSCAAADTSGDTLDAAVYLINRSMTVDRGGTHNLLLKAIRHLNDPDARPLFTELARSNHSGLKVHGVLGLAETSKDKQVDLSLIAQIDDPSVQATIISAAMDDKLLSHDQAKQLLRWDSLKDEVRVLIAVRLVEAGKFDDTDMLKRVASSSKKLGAGALAALLLMQLNDPTGREHLNGVVDVSQDPQRDAVRAMLLQTALRHELERAGPWALTVAGELGADPALKLLALRTALRFGIPGADTLWIESYSKAKDSPSQRVRLALTALHLSPWLDPNLFSTLDDSTDPMIQAIGEAGTAIASGSQDAADPIVTLLDFGHPLINTWALKFARDRASDSDARIILLGLVLAYQDSPQHGKQRRLDEAIQATEALYERDPNTAGVLLRPVITDPSTDKLLVQAILLGLVRTRSSDAVAVVEGSMDQLNSPDAQALALLLLARSDRTLDTDQLDQLSLLVRGAGRLEDSLRMQAAWTYLKRTGLSQQALAKALGTTSHE